MRFEAITGGILVAFMMLTPALADGEHGTKEEAVAMTKRAVSDIKSQGAEKVYTNITAKEKPYNDRDLYVIVYDSSGNVLAHGSNSALVGKNLSKLSYVYERIEKMKLGQPFWQEYSFTNPVTKKIEPKKTYCEVVTETAICVGYYSS